MEARLNTKDIAIAPDVCETASEDGAVLLDVNQGICFSLNSVGLRIWRMLKSHLSIEQIADALEHEFHVPRTEILVDISDFLSQLEAKQLIRRGAAQLHNRGWLSTLFTRGRERILPS